MNPIDRVLRIFKKNSRNFGSLYRARLKKGNGKGLILAYYDPEGLSTIAENISSWAQESKFDIDVWNFFGGSFSNGLALPANFSFDDFEFVIFHCTVTYNPENIVSIVQSCEREFSRFQGAKVLMKQDDHYKPHIVAKILGDYRFNILITIVEPSNVEVFYPQKLAGDVRAISVHTGYVSDTMKGIAEKFGLISGEMRPIHIGYRGSIQPDNFGVLAYEKRAIGDLVLQDEHFQNLVLDISSAWEDRYLGDQWYQFLARCKTVLGVESGASVVDFTGEIEKEVLQFKQRYPNRPFQELYSAILSKHENNAYYRAISPRHIEALATGTVQVLFEGEYSGILTPGRHYIELRRDFRNAQDVVRALKDIDFLQHVAVTAKTEVFTRPDLQYRHFVSSVDAEIEQVKERKI